MTPRPEHWPGAAPILSAARMRAAELACVAAGTSLSELMERAGSALADYAIRVAAGRPVLIMAGPGNNGGDGYVAARHLAARGADVRVVACAPPATDLARAAAAVLPLAVEPLTPQTVAAPVLIDALFGTGSRPLDGLLYATAQRLCQQAQRVIAADLPSGLDADAEMVGGAALHADVTLAFGAFKPAHVLQPHARHCGDIRLATLGISAEPDWFRLGVPDLPTPVPGDHKYSRGMVAVVAGAMAGAAELAARAALRAGAGYVMLAGSRLPPAPLYAIVRRRLDPAALADPRVGAIVIGPGLGHGEPAESAWDAVRGAGTPCVVDADALPLALRDGVGALLTPHAGEFARLFPDLVGSKLAVTLEAARRTGSVILHKGDDSVIAAPDGRAAVAGASSPWLATAGTGDVLAGIAGTMVARGLEPFAAACAAVALHNRAALRIGAGLCADDLVHAPLWP